MDAEQRAKLRALAEAAHYRGIRDEHLDAFVAAAHPAAVIELLDRCEALEALLRKAHSHLKYHREEFGVLRFDEPGIVDELDAALSGAEEKEGKAERDAARRERDEARALNHEACWRTGCRLIAERDEARAEVERLRDKNEQLQAALDPVNFDGLVAGYQTVIASHVAQVAALRELLAELSNSVQYRTDITRWVEQGSGPIADLLKRVATILQQGQGT